MAELVLSGGTLVTPSGAAVADVLIRDGRVAAIGRPPAVGDDVEIIDCSGMWVGPGFVDLHTHLREPGQEWKEDVASGSAAAAAGGYTAVVAMPNTDPPIDAGHVARFVTERGRAAGLVDVVPAGCLTAGRAGTRLAHLDDLWSAGVRIFTDDGDCVADAGVLRRAMEYLAGLGGVVAQHAIDPGLAAGGQLHEGFISSSLGMPGVPAEAESMAVARDLALVRMTGARYHVQHVSTAVALELVAAAKAEGLPVTAEVTPHHLRYTDEDARGTDPVFKMMPPLRSAGDVAALRAGVKDGTIDCVATDHAPHADHEKDVPWEDAPFGVTGLEWCAAAVHEAVGLDPVRFFEVMASAPARIAGLDDHGELDVGRPGHVVVFDPAAPAETSRTRSRSRNAPYLGATMTGRVRTVLYRGRLTVRDGEVVAGAGVA